MEKGREFISVIFKRQFSTVFAQTLNTDKDEWSVVSIDYIILLLSSGVILILIKKSPHFSVMTIVI